MNALLPFEFKGFAVRVVTRDGEPWFVATDVAEILGYRNAPDMVRLLDDDERGTHNLRTSSGNRHGAFERDMELTIISESGLYACVLRSRRPEANAFRKWVTGDVLPSIRRTGGFGQSGFDPASIPRIDMARMWLEAEEAKLRADQTIAAMTKQVAVMEPKVLAFDELAESEGSFTITEIAKLVQLDAKGIFIYLERNKWIYRRGDSPWMGTVDKERAGLLINKVESVENGHGGTVTRRQVRITCKGLSYLKLALAPAPLLSDPQEQPKRRGSARADKIKGWEVYPPKSSEPFDDPVEF